MKKQSLNALAGITLASSCLVLLFKYMLFFIYCAQMQLESIGSWLAHAMYAH